MLWHLSCQNKLRNITLKIALSSGSLYVLGKIFLKLKTMNIYIYSPAVQNSKDEKSDRNFSFKLIFTSFKVKS